MVKQKVGYLGPKGTFTKMAVDYFFNDIDKHGFKSIPACIDAVHSGDMDLGVVPVENAIEGSVNLTMDYLIHQVRLPIVGEIIVPIKQHLLIHPDMKLSFETIEKVLSHSHAIAQCHQYLHKQLPHADIQYTSSTGEAAALISQQRMPYAAIGNELARKEYGLTCIGENIHDYNNNHTKFAIIQKSSPLKVNSSMEVNKLKTTVMVTLPSDYAGALHQVLSAFSWRKMNLSKIESRPMKTGLGNYFFIVDVDQAYDAVLFPGVEAELKALGCRLDVLGSYPSYVINS